MKFPSQEMVTKSSRKDGGRIEREEEFPGLQRAKRNFAPSRSLALTFSPGDFIKRKRKEMVPNIFEDLEEYVKAGLRFTSGMREIEQRNRAKFFRFAFTLSCFRNFSSQSNSAPI